MRIVIVGAGKSGIYLSQKLRKDNDITLVDQRGDRVDVAETMLTDIDVVYGDACEPEVLEHVKVGEADLVIAATGDDEDNLVVTMLAKHFGAKRVFARINHPENEWLFTREWGVDVAVSSTAIMLSLVEKEIGFGDLVTLLKLQAENAAIEEIQLPESAECVGKTVAELELPPTVHIMAIISKDSGLSVARGDTLLSAGDQLLLLAEGSTDDSVRAALGLPPTHA